MSNNVTRLDILRQLNLEADRVIELMSAVKLYCKADTKLKKTFYIENAIPDASKLVAKNLWLTLEEPTSVAQLITFLLENYDRLDVKQTETDENKVNNSSPEESTNSTLTPTDLGVIGEILKLLGGK